MSILIKGMEMPKSCKECQVSFGYGNDVYCPFLFEPCDAVEDGLMWKECPKEGRLADCPLVEVKEPHGRLIDADALIAKKRKLYCDNCILRTGIKNGKKQFVYEIGAAPCRGCWIDDMVTELQDAPTIIEAEGSEDG